MATLINLMEDFCDKFGLPTPGAIVGSTDKTFTQLRALAHEVMEDQLVHPWPDQTSVVTFSGTADVTTGLVDAISTLFGTGYDKLLPGTMWNTTLSQPVRGPIGDAEWAAMVGSDANTAIESFKIMGGNLHILPGFTASQDFSVVVRTSYGIQDVGGTAKARFTADDDSPLIPANVFKAHLEWRWLKQKGESWAASYARAQGLTATLVAKDGHLPTLQLDQTAPARRPGIVIPPGSWDV